MQREIRRDFSDFEGGQVSRREKSGQKAKKSGRWEMRWWAMVVLQSSTMGPYPRCRRPLRASMTAECRSGERLSLCVVTFCASLWSRGERPCMLQHLRRRNVGFRSGAHCASVPVRSCDGRMQVLCAQGVALVPSELHVEGRA